jgi:hypothetical protein
VIFAVPTVILAAMGVYYTRNMDRREHAKAKLNQLTGGRLFRKAQEVPPVRNGAVETELAPVSPRASS